MTPATPAQRVAATVRAELARSRKTQAGLAVRLGLGRSAVNRRVTGQQPFDVAELHTVAEYLDLPVSALLPQDAAA